MPSKNTRKSIKIAPEEVSMPVLEEHKEIRRPFSRLKLLVGIGVLVLVLGVVWSRNKGWLFAATINGKPVSRMELNNRLTDRFGSQMLEAMIGERLILDEAGKQGAVASADEVKGKMDEVEKSLAGQMSLDESLKMQGITREEFENQVRIQLVIEKMLSKEVSVSAEEVTEYIKNNTKTMVASTDAERKTEADKEIRGNKMAQKFSEWFTKLKETAKVERYL